MRLELCKEKAAEGGRWNATTLWPVAALSPATEHNVQPYNNTYPYQAQAQAPREHMHVVAIAQRWYSRILSKIQDELKLHYAGNNDPVL
jgi:hypothetical protein